MPAKSGGRPPAARAKSRVSQLSRWWTWSTARPPRDGGRVAHNGDEYVGDPGCAHFSELLKLRAIGVLEEQGAAAEDLTLMDRLERPRGGQAVGVHGDFRVARLEFLHG